MPSNQRAIGPFDAHADHVALGTSAFIVHACVQLGQGCHRLTCRSKAREAHTVVAAVGRMESDPATLSALQHAWDRAFQRMRCTIVLCGSQIRVMELIQGAQSPLFGRLTGQWYLQPLPFSALTAFFPTWSVEERIAVSALVGGVPAYLGWLDPDLTFAENVRQVVLDPGSQFSAEPTLLIYDEVREPQPHLAILKAIGAGVKRKKGATKPTTDEQPAHTGNPG